MNQPIRPSVLFRAAFFALGPLGLCALLSGIGLATTPLASGEFQIIEDEGRISVHASEASVSELLKAIADQSGLEVIVMDGVGGLTSIELGGATPMAAIQAIAPRVVIVSGPDGEVSEVYVLPEGEAGSLPSGANIRSASGEGTQPFQFTFDPAAAPEMDTRKTE